MINIPSDLRKNKETIIGNMDLRESICLFIGLIFGIIVLYYIRVILGYKRIIIAAFISCLFVIPFLFIGFKRINGMKIDDYFKVFVNNKIIANSNRLPICINNELIVNKNKYEIIRYYKLNNKEDILILRKYLISKNIGLILTEYIDYDNCQYAVFRINGKELILDKIKRNKEDILRIKEEIKTNKNIEYIKELKQKLLELKNKKFNDIKNELDIFNGLDNIKIDRIDRKNVITNKKNAEILDTDIINIINIKLKNEEREFCELNLFCIDYFRDFINCINNKLIFINLEDKVDVYFYDNKQNKQAENIVDINIIDKKSCMYLNTINLDAKNYYNHYRQINDLREIL